MKKSAVVVSVMVLMAMLSSGCNEERVEAVAQKVVTRWCDMHTGSREALRARIDKATAPHRIRIECAGE
ncbi:hypothetical protein HBA55_34665 [Pseudomaricurvus alkylphenolicus]|uniref:hypothetical protein n=1 Tax=Pseudomaricurvus alkylphenolicus TaxID=1306991 RepID=UPI00141E85D2|nr:hypothetical protein [Pseudomaricurvus alkylphenolicus]NIB44775.1 hypothetical protein [Pseudomaricurvus alkylphenolicus]